MEIPAEEREDNLLPARDSTSGIKMPDKEWEEEGGQIREIKPHEQISPSLPSNTHTHTQLAQVQGAKQRPVCLPLGPRQAEVTALEMLG